VLALTESLRTDVPRRIAALLDAENVAKDIASHRLAPPGLRIWSWRHGGAERCQSVDAVARLGLRAVKQSLDIAA